MGNIEGEKFTEILISQLIFTKDLSSDPPKFSHHYIFIMISSNLQQVLMFYHLKTRRCVNTVLMQVIIN